MNPNLKPESINIFGIYSHREITQREGVFCHMQFCINVKISMAFTSFIFSEE